MLRYAPEWQSPPRICVHLVAEASNILPSPGSVSNVQKCSRHVKPLQPRVIAYKRKRYRPQAARQIAARFPRLQRHAKFPNKQPETECHGKIDSSMCLLSQIPICPTPSEVLHHPELFSFYCYHLLLPRFLES